MLFIMMFTRPVFLIVTEIGRADQPKSLAHQRKKTDVLFLPLMKNAGPRPASNTARLDPCIGPGLTCMNKNVNVNESRLQAMKRNSNGPTHGAVAQTRIPLKIIIRLATTPASSLICRARAVPCAWAAPP